MHWNIQSSGINAKTTYLDVAKEAGWEAVKDFNLVDLGCKGYPFMWSNKRYGPYLIEEKLDRFLGSKDWEQSSYKLTVTNLNSWCSDHSPIMLEIQEKTRFNWHQKKSYQRLHYEDMWSPYKECKRIVRREWM